MARLEELGLRALLPEPLILSGVVLQLQFTCWYCRYLHCPLSPLALLVTPAPTVLTCARVAVRSQSSGSSDSKESACDAGDLGSIPGSGRFPWEGTGNPLQYSCLENPMDRGVWWTAIHGVEKSRTQRSGSHGPRGGAGVLSLLPPSLTGVYCMGRT